MMKVWCKRDDNDPEKTKIAPDSDIDDLKEEFLGSTSKGEYRATYNGQPLAPSAKVPPNTTDDTPILFTKITGTIPAARNPVDPSDVQVKPLDPEPSNTNQTDLEIDIVRNSIGSDVLSLEHLVEAGELRYINKTSKDIANELVTLLNTTPVNLPKFIKECLTPIMFLLKREQNLDDFMTALTDLFEDVKNSTDPDDPSELAMFNLSLRRFLHVLLLSSDLFLRRIIMSLISKSNPVPLVHPNILSQGSNGKSYEFMPAITYVWNHTRPTLLSFGIGEQCEGKSSLLNSLFLSTFEQSMDSVYFQQTIDLDFGYSFLPERPVNIGDCHGEISLDLLRNIQSLFDGYLIHINEKWLEGHSRQLVEYLELLPSNKFYVIFIRDIKVKKVPSTGHHQCQRLIESSDILKTRHFSFFALTNMNTIDKQKDKKIRDLRDQLMLSIKDKIVTPIHKEMFDNEFKSLLTRTNSSDYVTEVEQMHLTIQPLKERLLIGQLESQSDSHVPLYLKFLELCKLRQELKKMKFYGNEGEHSFAKYEQVFRLECALNPQTSLNQECGSVFKMFVTILQSHHQLMTLHLLSSELKQKLLTLDSSQLSGKLSVSNSFLSLEVLWRNTMVCYNHTSSDNQHLIIESYVQYIRAGFPFEIIDGDQFNIQHEFLTEVMKHFQQQRILVISIVGPQNSGKSTLLNYMFGTLFEVRRGRCTRGVYGSFVKCIMIAGIDYIMLLDTEGLLSILKGDKEYDRRLVVFCLAVTHLMIVNVDKELSEELRDLLTVCTDSLKHMDVTKVLKPTVHFVLNQYADPDIKNQSAAIEKILGDLRLHKLDEMISSSTETFHILPAAFKQERLSNASNSSCLIRSDPSFLELSQKLASVIAESAKTHYEQPDNTSLTPPQWLSRSVVIFDILQRFPDLTYFKDIYERQQNDKMQEYIAKTISETFSSGYRKTLIDRCVTECNSEDEIKEYFQEKFTDHQTDLETKLAEYSQHVRASDRIRSRCQEILRQQITECRNAWRTAAIQAFDKEQMKIMVRGGEADLRKLIDEIINSGIIMTKDEATRKFERLWSNKIAYINTNFNPEERLKQALKYVYGNYNIFEKKCLPAPESVISKMATIHRLIETFKSPCSQCSCREGTNATQTQVSSGDKQEGQCALCEHSFIIDHALETHCIELMKKFRDMLGQELANLKENLVENLQLSVTVTAIENFVYLRGISSLSSLDIANRKNIRDKITTELNQSPSSSSNRLPLTVFIEKTYEKLQSLIEDKGNTCTVEIDLIQRIVGAINTQFDSINRELYIAGLSLSLNTKSEMHTNILLMLTVLFYLEQQEHFKQQLKILATQKPFLLTYFLSMVIPDVSFDAKSATIFVDQLLNAIKGMLKDNARDIIEKKLDDAQGKLSRHNLQDICDGNISTANDQWLKEYIEDPTKKIQEGFEKRWELITPAIDIAIKDAKDGEKIVLLKFFHITQAMSNALIDQGGAVKFINELFTAARPDGSAAEHLTNKGQCMFLLLLAYLTNEPIVLNMSFNTTQNKTYILTRKGNDYFQRLQQPDPALVKLINRIRNLYSYSDGSANQIAVMSIKIFQVFLKNIIDTKDNALQRYEAIPSASVDYGIDQHKNRLWLKGRGCTELCPFCQRPCDVDHTLHPSQPGDSNNKHRCHTGHQLRAFIGVKVANNNEASLYQCDQMPANFDFVKRDGTRKKWRQLIQEEPEYQKWNFELPSDIRNPQTGTSIGLSEHLARVRSRYLYIWSRIGRHFCQKYKMVFVTNNTQVSSIPESYHFILLLDTSGSMQGDPWAKLIGGVNILIQARKNGGGPQDRITIIPFDSAAVEFCFNQTMNNVDTTTILFTSGGTAFGPPVKMATEKLRDMKASNINAGLKSIIVFMSDGASSFPAAELSDLKSLRSDIKEFWTVSLGAGPTLKQINDEMGGIYKELNNASELGQVYAAIAETF